MKKWLKKFKNEKGLTLIELLAVVVILGIIAAIAVPSISNIIDNSKKDAQVSNALLIINAAKLGEVSNDSVVAKALRGTDGTGGSVTIKQLVDNGFLDSTPKNPNSDSAYKSGTVTYTVTTKGSGVKKGSYSISLQGTSPTDQIFIDTTVTEEKLNSDGKKLVK